MPAGNQNLTSGQVLPGFFGKVNYNSSAPAGPPNLRTLLWGYVSATAIATPNAPIRPASQSDCDALCGGANTDLARSYAAALSQPGSDGSDVWILPILETAGGVKSTYTLTVYVSNTNPAKPGTLQVWVASQQIAAVGFTTTDTATTIAAALAAALTAQQYIPITSAIASVGVVTITYILKGTTGEDFPMRAQVAPSSGSGVNLSPAQLLFAVAAVGAGSVVVNIGATTVTIAIANADTPAQIATKVAAGINASTYPVTAVVDGSTPAQVNLYFNGQGSGFDVRRISAAVVTSTGTTVNAGSGATSGTGSAASLTYNGTQGTGAPSLGTAITALTDSSEWYRSWMAPWTDTATLGVLATYLEAAKDGSITGQKWQILTICDHRALATAGAVAPAVSPNLTTSDPNYAIGWSPDCAVQAFELSARVAVARAAYWISAPQKNWNGYRLTGNTRAPILGPTTAPSKTVLNSALRTYALSPWVKGYSGNYEIVKGRTTSLASDMRLWSWSAEAQASYHLQDLQAYFAQIFQGGNLISHGPPKADGLFDDQSFKDATASRLRLWESQGNYDGAETFASQIAASRNENNINREDVDFPESPVVDLDQVCFTGFFMSSNA